MYKPKDEYIYAVSRIRHRETKLFTKKHIEQMISMPDAESVLRFLAEQGFGATNKLTEEIDPIDAEREKLWALMKELLGDLDCFDFLRIQNDFQNLKAAIKAQYSELSTDGLFMSGSVYDPEELAKAIAEKDYSSLPEVLREVGENAHKTLLKTADGQLCDMIIDKACLETVYAFGKKSSEKIVSDYCELFVASSDIKIAVRGSKLLKSQSFILDSLAECESLNIRTLASASAKGFEDLLSYLSTTDYKWAVEHIKVSLTDFEKYCDNKLIGLLKSQKAEPFTLGPLVAYAIAKENEIKAVRLILTAKENDLADSVIRERIRDMYV